MPTPTPQLNSSPLLPESGSVTITAKKQPHGEATFSVDDFPVEGAYLVLSADEKSIDIALPEGASNSAEYQLFQLNGQPFIPNIEQLKAELAAQEAASIPAIKTLQLTYRKKINAASSENVKSSEVQASSPDDLPFSTTEMVGGGGALLILTGLALVAGREIRRRFYRLLTTIDHLNKELSDAQKEKGDLVEESTQRIARIEQEKRTAEEQTHAAEVARTQTELKIGEAEQRENFKVDALEAQLAYAQRKLEQADHSIGVQISVIGKKNAEIERLNGEISEISGALAHAKEQIESHEHDIALEEHIWKPDSGENLALSEAQKLVDVLRTQVVELEGRIQVLKSEKEQATSEARDEGVRATVRDIESALPKMILVKKAPPAERIKFRIAIAMENAEAEGFQRGIEQESKKQALLQKWNALKEFSILGTAPMEIFGIGIDQATGEIVIPILQISLVITQRCALLVKSIQDLREDPLIRLVDAEADFDRHIQIIQSIPLIIDRYVQIAETLKLRQGLVWKEIISFTSSLNPQRAVSIDELQALYARYRNVIDESNAQIHTLKSGLEALTEDPTLQLISAPLDRLKSLFNLFVDNRFVLESQPKAQAVLRQKEYDPIRLAQRRERAQEELKNPQKKRDADYVGNYSLIPLQDLHGAQRSQKTTAYNQNGALDQSTLFFDQMDLPENAAVDSQLRQIQIPGHDPEESFHLFIQGGQLYVSENENPVGKAITQRTLLEATILLAPKASGEMPNKIVIRRSQLGVAEVSKKDNSLGQESSTEISSLGIDSSAAEEIRRLLMLSTITNNVSSSQPETVGSTLLNGHSKNPAFRLTEQDNSAFLQ